jgi:hypothetical protein
MSVGNKNHQKRLLGVCKKMKCVAFVLKMKDYFYLVEIQYCYASILSERMNREIEEKEVIQSRRIQRGKGYYEQCIHPGAFKIE